MSTEVRYRILRPEQIITYHGMLALAFAERRHGDSNPIFSLCFIDDMEDALKQQLARVCEISGDLNMQDHGNETERLIQVAVKYIDHNLTKNLTVGDYAQHVHMSTSYFARLFKHTIGLTVHRYVINQRIRLAEHMLLQDKQVQEIASALGYDDRRYFTELFKKITGVTPTEFKRNKHGNAGSPKKL